MVNNNSCEKKSPAVRATGPVLTVESHLPGDPTYRLSRFRETLGGLGQFLAALQRLVNALWQLIPTPVPGAVVGGPQPVQLSLAEHVGPLAHPVRALVLLDNRPNGAKAEACLACYRSETHAFLAELTNVFHLGVTGLERTAETTRRDGRVVLADELVPLPNQLLVLLVQGFVIFP